MPSAPELEPSVQHLPRIRVWTGPGHEAAESRALTLQRISVSLSARAGEGPRRFLLDEWLAFPFSSTAPGSERSTSEGLVSTPLCTRCCLEADKSGTSGQGKAGGGRAVWPVAALCVCRAVALLPLGSSVTDPLLSLTCSTGWLCTWDPHTRHLAGEGSQQMRESACGCFSASSSFCYLGPADSRGAAAPRPSAGWGVPSPLTGVHRATWEHLASCPQAPVSSGSGGAASTTRVVRNVITRGRLDTHWAPGVSFASFIPELERKKPATQKHQ